MTRAWLILADILVTLLLFFSFILFYLYPIKKEQASTVLLPTEQNMTLNDFSLDIPRIDNIMTMEELMRMGEQYSEEAFIRKEQFVDVPLDESLKLLSAKIGDPIFMRIFKEESRLEIWIRTGTEYQLLKEYRICSYSGSLGPKLKEGDKQSPEGFYKVAKHQLNPNSKFHLSFNLGYPNKYDRTHKRTGSFLMVHGNCVSIGCYAMTDDKIEEIYALLEGALDNGQHYVQVHVYPFRMTEENMAEYSDSKWYDFWVNLKEGYDYFEAEKLPPLVKVEHKQYTIHEGNE